LTVFRLAPGSRVAGVFTRNRFCAAPVQVCQRHLAAHADIRVLVINTGNANAGTGADGLAHAEQTCAALAELLNLSPQQVLPFSTGVIMEPLPVDRLLAALPAAIADCDANHWHRAAFGIMTTDTQPKIYSRHVADQTITVTGVSKGAGMIRPNMATMLSYLATDAGVAPRVVCLARARTDRCVAQPHFHRRRYVHQRFVHPDCHGQKRRIGAVRIRPALQDSARRAGGGRTGPGAKNHPRR